MEYSRKMMMTTMKRKIIVVSGTPLLVATCCCCPAPLLVTAWYTSGGFTPVGAGSDSDTEDGVRSMVLYSRGHYWQAGDYDCSRAPPVIAKCT
jgi:hypothetical protein